MIDTSKSAALPLGHSCCRRVHDTEDEYVRYCPPKADTETLSPNKLPAYMLCPPNSVTTGTTDPVFVYPFLRIYEHVYPYFEIYPGNPIPFEKDFGPANQEPKLYVNVPSYPAFNLYSTLYPYNLNSIYPPVVDQQFVGQKNADSSQSIETLPTSSNKFPQISVHLQVYPCFNLYPPLYPCFDIYPSTEPRNIMKEEAEVSLSSTSETLVLPVGDSHIPCTPFYKLFPGLCLKQAIEPASKLKGQIQLLGNVLCEVHGLPTS